MTIPPIAAVRDLPLLDQGPSRFWGLLVFTPLLLLGNEFGAAYRYPEIGAAVLYPPYAILTVALLISQRRDWVWYVLAAVAAHFVTHLPDFPLSWVLLANVANTARALTAALLLGWIFPGVWRLDNTRSLSLFLITAVILAPAVGATVGATSVVWHGAADSWFGPWRGWFMSNALTGLTLLPALMLLAVNAFWWRREPVALERVAEALVLGGLLGVACWAAYLSTQAESLPDMLLPYAPLPVLILTALRFGPGGVSLVLTFVTFVAIAAANRGSGPFASSAPDHTILTLQLLVLLTALPMLCIAVVNTARHSTMQLHRALLASLQDHVAIVDSRGVVLEVNGAWQRCADADRCHLHNVNIGDNYTHACATAVAHGNLSAASALAGIRHVLTGKQRRFEMEYDCDCTSEASRYALTIESLERSDGGAVVRRADISARRQAQMQLEEQRSALSHLARVAVLGELTGTLAHELNQPLTSIMANAEAARYMLEKDPPDVAELDTILADITAADMRAAHVIQRLRALLKRDATRMQPLDVGELVYEVLELARGDLVARDVTATVATEPDLALVLADRVQLQQVLLNLILNACESMSTTPASERSLLLAVSTDENGSVLILVRDRGTGIPSAVIDRLFEPFVTTKPQGLGLGLSISRTIIAAHGGRLWAENNADGGATLYFTVPPVATAAPARWAADETTRAVAGLPILRQPT